MTRTIIHIIICVLLTHLTEAQKEDHVWLFGSAIGDQFDPIWLADTTWGATNFDFKYTPPKIYYDSTRIWDFAGTNASICDTNGNLLFYTNGQAIYDGKHDVIEDTINYSLLWENFTLVENGIVNNLGLPFIQSAITINSPSNNNLYYAFYQSYDLIESFTSGVLYAELTNTSGTLTLINKDIPLLIDSLGGGGLNAVRHANGRDWWLLFSGRMNNEMFLYLIDPDGIHDMGVQKFEDSFEHSLGQLYFSPNGEYLGINSGYKIGFEGTQFVLLEFDRCTGLLTNRISQKLDVIGISSGISFSPNNRFVYVSTDSHVYQYDLSADDIISSRLAVAEYDGYEYFYPPDTTFGVATFLGWMGLAPDGKIYISSGSASNRKMHVINKPNNLGGACDLRQHSLCLPTSYRRTIPNFPNFRLGPLDGSPCDTLGLDNHPIAKFRCVQDSIDEFQFYFTDLSFYDPVDYHWDFGVSTSEEKNPNFNFEKKGIYEVCLTVSNEYDEDTFCKSIQIGTNSTNEQISDDQINIFPNPVSSDLLISFHDYFPIDANIKLYDFSGRLVFESDAGSSWNNYDINHLKPGTYIINIYDESVLIKSEKIIKI